jgi:hypothetical protein
MDTLNLRNLLFRQTQTVRYSQEPVWFLEKFVASSNAGFGIEVDGDALANVRAAS